MYFVKGSGFMAEFNKRDFGERLRNFRKNKGLSQENLAKVIGKMQQLLVDLKMENSYQTQSKYF